MSIVDVHVLFECDPNLVATTKLVLGHRHRHRYSGGRAAVGIVGALLNGPRIDPWGDVVLCGMLIEAEIRTD